MLRFVNVSYEKLKSSFGAKSIICYGAGKQFDNFFETLAFNGMRDWVACCIDRHPEKYSGKKCVNQYEIPVITLEEYVKAPIPSSCIVITVANDYQNIIRDLDRTTALDGKLCTFSFLLKNEEGDLPIQENEEQCIPRMVHYCWFGNSEMPDQFKRYIDGWSKLCPDYEIKRWDESNYDVTKNQYMYAAYQEKKWGFVPDYARLDIVYHYGGIYMDTDVKLLKPLDDFLHNEMFCSFEDMQHIAFGLPFGAVPGHPVIKALRDDYENRSFYHSDGSLNRMPSPIYQTEAMERMGLICNGRTQKFGTVQIYSRDYFCPYTEFFKDEHLITDHTYAIHDYAFSWGSKQEKSGLEGKRAFLQGLIQERMEWL